MDLWRCAGAVTAAFLLAAGCGGSDSGARPGRAETPAPLTLTVGGCAAPDPRRGQAAYRVANCDDPAATARAISVSDPVPGVAGRLSGPNCVATTDLVLSISQLPANALPSNGYACMRNLRPPHPGDPGNGGGRIIAGDCLRVTGKTAREVACDAGNARYKVLKMTLQNPYEAPCPASTDAEFTIRQATTSPALPEIACARKL